ncbi:MAG TPA: dCTP deaminase [Holosporales bacterium]|nr:dCTP deaminase [Holosporales bacterium]
MFLSDIKIKDLLEKGDLFITPKPAEKDIRPNAIRVHLCHTLIKYEDQTVDPTKDIDIKHSTIDLTHQPYTLKPGEFILGSTIESIRTPRNLCGFLDGRSTLARLGLNIHITAAVTDGLYEDARTITLEIQNAGNMHIVLSHNMAIGSLLFAELDQPVAQSTQGRYKGQQGATVANLKDQLT